jgi:hypothetical protein
MTNLAENLIATAGRYAQRPAVALRQGVARDVDLLIGYTRDEYRLWFVPSGLMDRAAP